MKTIKKEIILTLAAILLGANSAYTLNLSQKLKQLNLESDQILIHFQNDYKNNLKDVQNWLPQLEKYSDAKLIYKKRIATGSIVLIVDTKTLARQSKRLHISNEERYLRILKKLNQNPNIKYAVADLFIRINDPK